MMLTLFNNITSIPNKNTILTCSAMAILVGALAFNTYTSISWWIERFEKKHRNDHPTMKDVIFPTKK